MSIKLMKKHAHANPSDAVIFVLLQENLTLFPNSLL